MSLLAGVAERVVIRKHNLHPNDPPHWNLFLPRRNASSPRSNTNRRVRRSSRSAHYSGPRGECGPRRFAKIRDRPDENTVEGAEFRVFGQLSSAVELHSRTGRPTDLCQDEVHLPTCVRTDAVVVATEDPSKRSGIIYTLERHQDIRACEYTTSYMWRCSLLHSFGAREGNSHLPPY
jgi:hypothetical protein